MRFRRVRFTVRRVLVAVVWIAVLLAVTGPLLRRRDYCLRMAARPAEAEARARAAMRSHRARAGEFRLALMVSVHFVLRASACGTLGREPRNPGSR